MPQLPYTLPFIFGLVKADSSLPVSAVVSAGAGRGIATSTEILAGTSADVRLDALAQGDTAITADTSGYAGWSIRGTPTIEVTLDAGVQLAALADADLGAAAATPVDPGFGLDTATAVTVDTSAGSRLDGVVGGGLVVAADSYVVFTYNADSGLVVAADSSGAMLLDGLVGADAVGLADALGVLSRGQDLTTATAVTVELSAGIQFNGVLDSGLPVEAAAPADLLYTQYLDADLGVVGDVSGSALNAAAEGADLSVSVSVSGLLDRDTLGDADAPVGAVRDAAALNNAPIAGDVSVAADPIAQARFGGQSQGDLGAITGLPAAGVRATFGAADRTVTVTITAGASLAQRVESVTAVTASPVNVPQRGRFVTASTSQAVAAVSGAALRSAFVGGAVQISGATTAAAKVDQVVSASLVLSVLLAARAQLGGTPQERIAIIDSAIRLAGIAAESRTLSIGERINQ